MQAHMFVLSPSLDQTYGLVPNTNAGKSEQKIKIRSKMKAHQTMKHKKGKQK